MRALILVLAVVLSGCVAGGIEPGPGPVFVPFHQTSSIDGEITFGSIFVLGQPYTFPIRAWGVGDVIITITDPRNPQIEFIGEGGWVVEPITPSAEPTVRAMVARGQIRFPGGHLSPAGSIARRAK